jgi:DNA-binding transcriptional ArsR family regulator
VTRTCTLCSHPRRNEIERELVNRSSSYRDIARQFSISKDAVSRHASRGHIAERLLKAQNEEDIREALNLVKQLKLINAMAVTILTQARDEGDPELALRAIDRVLRQLEFQAKLDGQINEQPVINIHLHREWIELRTAILIALEPHPEARDAFLAALEGVSNGYARG